MFSGRSLIYSNNNKGPSTELNTDRAIPAPTYRSTAKSSLYFIILYSIKHGEELGYSGILSILFHKKKNKKKKQNKKKTFPHFHAFLQVNLSYPAHWRSSAGSQVSKLASFPICTTRHINENIQKIHSSNSFFLFQLCRAVLYTL